MIAQETLFETPTPVADVPQPPVPPKPVVQAEPLGPCAKAGCDEPGVLKSPGGSIYCSKHGYCSRRTCLKSVEKFVMHPRLKIWVCSCVIKLEKECEIDD